MEYHVKSGITSCQHASVASRAFAPRPRSSTRTRGCPRRSRRQSRPSPPREAAVAAAALARRRRSRDGARRPRRRPCARARAGRCGRLAATAPFSSFFVVARRSRFMCLSYAAPCKIARAGGSRGCRFSGRRRETTERRREGVSLPFAHPHARRRSRLTLRRVCACEVSFWEIAVSSLCHHRKFRAARSRCPPRSMLRLLWGHYDTTTNLRSRPTSSHGSTRRL